MYPCFVIGSQQALFLLIDLWWALLHSVPLCVILHILLRFLGAFPIFMAVNYFLYLYSFLDFLLWNGVALVFLMFKFNVMLKCCVLSSLTWHVLAWVPTSSCQTDDKHPVAVSIRDFVNTCGFIDNLLSFLKHVAHFLVNTELEILNRIEEKLNQDKPTRVMMLLLCTDIYW